MSGLKRGGGWVGERRWGLGEDRQVGRERERESERQRQSRRSQLLRGGKKRKEKAIDRLPSKISYWISLTETTAF